MSFGGRVIWVTGASSGIGEALAYELARRGAKLVLTARRESELKRVKEACERPFDHWVYPFDLLETDAIGAWAADVIERVGPIDVLVYAAGLGQRGDAVRTPLAVDRRLMELNFFGAVALSKALLPSMLDRGRGHIVPISSVSGRLGTPFRTAYAASKHALHGFFDSLRAELHAQGLRVTIATPGYVRTSLSMNALTDDGTPHGQTDDHTRRGITAAECATAIAQSILREEEEVLVGGVETLGVWLKRLTPRLASRIVRSVNRPAEPPPD